MVPRSDSYSNSSALLQLTRSLSSPATPPQDFFINHQQWQISRDLDYEMLSPVFYLKDFHGVSYVVTEFILENLDPEFEEELTQIDLAQKQQELIHEYLRSRLNQANSHQVHIGFYVH